MSDQTLVLMFDEVRQSLLEILAIVDEPTARWHPPGLQNTIIWHAGHCYVVIEWLSMEALDKQPESPAGWFEMFSWDSRPGSVAPEQWPSLGTVIQQLQSQHERLRRFFASLTEEQLSGPAADSPQQAVRQIILHAFQDEAAHKGETWLLWKLRHKSIASTSA